MDSTQNNNTSEVEKNTNETNDNSNDNSNDNDNSFNLDDINLNNINPDDINKLLSNLNLDNGNNLESLIQNFSKGKIGSVLKDFTNIISSNESVEDEEDVEFDISNNNLSIDEECEEQDFELNLEKYFMSSDGKNICDILIDVKCELQNINKNLLEKNLSNK